jgi:hypothetical protein
MVLFALVGGVALALIAMGGILLFEAWRGHVSGQLHAGRKYLRPFRTHARVQPSRVSHVPSALSRHRCVVPSDQDPTTMVILHRNGHHSTRETDRVGPCTPSDAFRVTWDVTFVAANERRVQLRVKAGSVSWVSIWSADAPGEPFVLTASLRAD